LHLSVLTHWETLTYFMKLPPLPKSRALLGARSAKLGKEQSVTT